MLRESRVFGFSGKKSWWCNENVEIKVKIIIKCFKVRPKCKNTDT